VGRIENSLKDQAATYESVSREDESKDREKTKVKLSRVYEKLVDQRMTLYKLVNNMTL